MNLAIYVSSYSTVIIMHLPVCRGCMRMECAESAGVWYMVQLHTLFGHKTKYMMRPPWCRHYKNTAYGKDACPVLTRQNI